MRRKYPIQLIPLSYVTGADLDSVESGTPRPVLADRKSAKMSEFYPALANGLRPEVVFTIWAFEYKDEPRLTAEGKTYEIIRTYTGKDEREIELVCQTLDLVQTGLSRLRDTVEIWHIVFSENSLGKRVAGSERFATVPAEIEYAGGNTGNPAGDVIETTNRLTVKIKYREGIRPDMFLMIGGQRYDIQYIEDPYNRHETLILHAERKVPG